MLLTLKSSIVFGGHLAELTVCDGATVIPFDEHQRHA
jgi:hypothetical protein